MGKVPIKRVSKIQFPFITWRCDVCGEMRVDSKISVRKVVLKYGDRIVPKEIGYRNVKYCNDREECKKKVMSEFEGIDD